MVIVQLYPIAMCLVQLAVLLVTITAITPVGPFQHQHQKKRVVGFAETPRTKTDEDYALDRYFHFNNKDDFANPIDNGFAFPKSEFDHEHGEEEEEDDDLHNFSTSPTSQGVTYTTNFRKV